MSSVNLVIANPRDSTGGSSLDQEVTETGQTKTCWEPSDWRPSSKGCFIVLVAECGRQILVRREGDVISAAHDFKPSKSPYESAQQFREEVCSYFGITAHTYIAVDEFLSDFVEDYSYLCRILEVTDDACSVFASDPFVWIDWRTSDLEFDRSFPHPHIGRFLVSYLADKHVEEMNFAATPWRRLGFYSTLLHRVGQLVSDAGYKMKGNPEQVHYGSRSTVYKIPTKQGDLFCKIGFKGNGEPKKTKVITEVFPDVTPRVLGVDVELEMMICEDHGPSVSALCYVRRSDRPRLDESELKLLFGAVLRQWARLQKESSNCTQELAANGIPSYDMQWIRSSFSELTTYMREVELDTVHPKVLAFGEYMERTFEIWERFNIPSTLVHGDLHDSNVAQPGGLGTKFIFFDWDSSFIGHPFLDLDYDETWDFFLLGEEAYLECWKEYGDIESLRRLALWTRPVHYLIKAVCETHRDTWTATERRRHVEYRLESLTEAWEKCDSESDWGILGA